MKKTLTVLLLVLACLLFFAACNIDLFGIKRPVKGFTGAISTPEDFLSWTDYGGDAYLTKDLTVYESSYELVPGKGGSDFNLNLNGHTLTFGDPADLSKGLEPLKKAKKASLAKVTVVSTVKLKIESVNDSGVKETAKIEVKKDTSADAPAKQGTLIQNEGGKVGLDGVDVGNEGGGAPLFTNTKGGDMDIKDSTLTSSPTDNSTPSDLIMTDSGEVNLNNVDTDKTSDEPLIKVVNSVESVLTSDTDADEPAYGEKPVVNLVDSFKDTTPSDLIEGSEKAEVTTSVTATITVTPTSLTLTKDETATLTAVVSPSDSGLVWTTSGNGVTSVSNKGVVTALKAGKDTVRVTVEGKSNIYAECEVIVFSSDDDTTPDISKYKLSIVVDNSSEGNAKMNFYFDDVERSSNEAKGIFVYNALPQSAGDSYLDFASQTTTVEIDPNMQYLELESAAYMFSNFVLAHTITGLEYLKMDNVTDVTNMFYAFGQLNASGVELDLSSWNLSNVTVGFDTMFSTDVSQGGGSFYGTIWEVRVPSDKSPEGVSWYTDSGEILPPMGKTFTPARPEAVLDGTKLKSALNSLLAGGNKSVAWTVTDGTVSEDGVTNIVSTNDSPVRAWVKSDGYNVEIMTNGSAFAVTDKRTFEDLFRQKNIVEIVGMNNIIVRVPSASCAEMFYNTTSLTDIKFDVRFGAGASCSCHWMFMASSAKKITFGEKTYLGSPVRMDDMFSFCNNLEEVSFLDTKGRPVINTTAGLVTDMFSDCRSLKKANLTGIKTDSTTNVSRMFQRCYSVEEIIFDPGFVIGAIDSINGNTKQRIFEGFASNTDYAKIEGASFEQNGHITMKRLNSATAQEIVTLLPTDKYSWKAEPANDVDNTYNVVAYPKKTN